MKAAMGPRRHALLAGAALALAAGAALAAALAAAYPGPAALLALLAGAGGAGAALLLMLVAGKRALVYLLLLLRASCDPMLDAVKAGNDGGMGPGAVLNGLLILLALLFVLRQPRRAWRLAVPAWGPFLLVALAACLIAPGVDAALRLLLVQLSYAAAFVLPYYLVRGAADRRGAMGVLLWASLAPVLAGLVQLLGGAGAAAATGDAGLRLQGTFNHPNIFAFFLLLTGTVVLQRLKLQAGAGPGPGPGDGPPTGLRRAALWCYLALLLLLLLGTKTRSAWGAGLFIALCYGLFFRRRYLLLLVALPLLALLDADIRDRLLDLTANNDSVSSDNLNSYAWRMVLWKSGLGWMDPSRMWFGYGLDTFSFYSPQFFPLLGNDQWNAHNVYVQLFFETGLAGVLAYLWLFAAVLRALLRSLVAGAGRGNQILTVALLVSYLLMAASDNMLYYLAFNWYFWFFIGTACALLPAQRGAAEKSVKIGPCAPTTPPAATTR